MARSRLVRRRLLSPELERIARKLAGRDAECVDFPLRFDHAQLATDHGAIEAVQFLVAGPQFLDIAPDLLLGLLGPGDIPDTYQRQKRLSLRCADENAAEPARDQVAPVVLKGTLRLLLIQSQRP